MTELEGLRAGRDYYRRRWILRGIRWPNYMGWRKAYDALLKAIGEDS